MIVFIVEDKIVEAKRLDNTRAIGVDMIINLVLHGLSIFADARANVGRKSQNVEK